MGRFSRSPEVEASSVGDRVVLYHRTTRNALVLNPMATWLWELLGVPRTTAYLVAAIRGAFPEVTEHRAGKDLAALLDDLVRHGVVAREA
jgi:coenzyme PQQ synthesis protein D (PqqD)